MASETKNSGSCRFVTFRVDTELLGIPVTQVQEVLPARPVTRIPLAPDEISGFLNLRGQIVTCIDLRRRLGLPARPTDDSGNHVILQRNEELVSISVDLVGDVIDTDWRRLGPPPATLGAVWREFCQGVIQLERGLLVVLDTEKVLDIQIHQAV